MIKDLLTSPTEELGRWGRFVVFQIKVWPHCIKLLRQNRCGQQAAALAYHTIFGIIPLAIVMMMIFQLFPAYRDVGENVKTFIYEQARLTDIKYTDAENPEDDIKLTDQLDNIIESFISNLNAGAITLFSCVIVIWAALGLLGTIERSFNHIWRVGRGRNFVHRIVNYWALLTLGPLLLGLGLFISTRYLVTSGFEAGALGFLRPSGPYAISVVAMFFLYFVMPNTRVSAKAALWGAVIAALIWTLAKIAFRIYITKFIPQKAVYGVMGIIPLSVLWIYITWMIVLFGLQLTFATQHLSALNEAEMAEMRKTENYFIANDQTSMTILSFLLEEFERRRGPVPAEVVYNKLGLPEDFGDKILDHFVAEKLLCRTTEPEAGYIPATDGNNITLADIADAVANASYAQDDKYTPGALKAIVEDYHNRLKECTLMQTIDTSEDQSQNETES